MAGMFYTLQEVAEKLGKNEAEIRNLVKEGKLREFRDGAKQLYKIEDVDAIAKTLQPAKESLGDSLEISIDETGEVSLAPEELDVLMGTGDKNLETKFKLDETGELLADEKLDEPSPSATKSSGSEILLSPAETAAAADRLDTTAGAPIDDSSTSEIALTSTSQQGSDIAGDTKITQGGDTINVLSESDTGYKISDDTSGETKLIDNKPSALDQKGSADGIARLDEDINLEGAGSGSGLLDLSLQADDTSLGAVLDDIYPDNQSAPAAGVEAPLPGVGEESAIAAETGEDDKMFQPQPEVEVPQEVAAEPMHAVPAGVAVAVYEAAPDSASNIFGALLFIPFAVLLYSVIVVISGFTPISLPIVTAVGPIIWYIAGGIAFATIIGVLAASMAGAPKKPKTPKAAKPAKVKPAKEKKAKK